MAQNATGQQTVLITGGAGFIGSHLCARMLDEGHRVICLDSFLTGHRKTIEKHLDDENFTLIKADIIQLPRIEGPVDRIYNMACAASPPLYQADPVHTLMTNVIGVNNLLVLAAEKNARFLQASTSEVYGDPLVHPQSEDYWGNVSCTGPRACYDEGKRSAETLCFEYLRAGKVDTRVARLFNTYGAHMRPDDGRIVSNLICQALSGVPLTIYGSGQQTRSFCYVSDLVDGLIALMEYGVNPEVPINLGNPGEFTIMELASMVREKIPESPDLVFMPLPVDDPQRRRPDIKRARELLGWSPRIDLNTGLDKT
ncbi:SDR family oxidoreductase, partial [Paracoccus aestuarii]